MAVETKGESLENGLEGDWWGLVIDGGGGGRDGRKVKMSACSWPARLAGHHFGAGTR